MFLALNELFKERARFILILLVVTLVSYLTFFLAALAYGLANSYTQGIEKWDAGGIVLQKDANGNIARSLLSSKDSGALGQQVAPLGVGNATIEAQKPEDVSLFGIDMNGFLAPNITEGRVPQDEEEVIASEKIKETGVLLNDKIRFKGSTQEFIVVGFTNNATFQTAPIIYLQLDSWRSAVSELAGMIGMKDTATVSAFVTKSTPDTAKLPDNLQWFSIKDYAFQLPGYKPQVLTFGTMIGFLVIIASLVLAIFMYILTLQKKNIFGVLKAEGIPSSYIARSVLVQAVLLASLGTALGLCLALASGLAAGSAIPFLVQPLFFAAIACLFVICAAIGGTASVLTVTKIDPAEAIG